MRFASATSRISCASRKSDDEQMAKATMTAMVVATITEATRIIQEAAFGIKIKATIPKDPVTTRKIRDMAATRKRIRTERGPLSKVTNLTLTSTSQAREPTTMSQGMAGAMTMTMMTTGTVAQTATIRRNLTLTATLATKVKRTIMAVASHLMARSSISIHMKRRMRRISTLASRFRSHLIQTSFPASMIRISLLLDLLVRWSVPTAMYQEHASMKSSLLIRGS